MSRNINVVLFTIAVALALVTMATVTTIILQTPASALNKCQQNFGKDDCRGCRNSIAANASEARCFTHPNN